MSDFPLTIASILRHGQAVHGASEIVTFEGESCRRADFTTVAARAERLAAALRRLGIGAGDRVGTFAWNTQEHFEAYLAVPSMGAVLHTLNLRLFPEQLTWVVNHAEDRVILLDATLVPLLARVAADLKTVERIVILEGPGGSAAVAGVDGFAGEVSSYEDLLAGEEPGFAWPELDESAAAAMCYTSGTTGNPKGVVYSHRSTWLHSMLVCTGSALGLTDRDRILPVVPMFHASAWGLPYAGWMAGSDFILTGRFLQGGPLCRLITTERPTVAGAVPSVWSDLLACAAREPGTDLSSMRLVLCGGSAVPRHLIEAFGTRHGVPIVQGWGMTETSPLAAVAQPPKTAPPGEAITWRALTGRVVQGVELRLVADDGTILPWDGESVGEIEVRGPWVTASYYRDDSPEAAAKFDDGWLRTGDVGSVLPEGFIRITDRAKDVIKSGGEWISSVDLEGELMAHPAVSEAAVIGVPDERWDERPLACVVVAEGASVTVADLVGHLGGRVAKWWVPERWAFIDEVPKTSVGKFDKKVLRARYAAGGLDVTTA